MSQKRVDFSNPRTYKQYIRKQPPFSDIPTQSVIEELAQSLRKEEVLTLTSMPSTIPKGTKAIIFKIQTATINTLPSLPQGLLFLDVTNMGLTQLPPLPQSLKILNCVNNQLTSLPNLAHTDLRILDCQRNDLTSLPTLPKTLLDLKCYSNSLKDISTVLPEGLERLDLKDNPLETIPLLPKSLKFFGYDEENLVEPYKSFFKQFYGVVFDYKDLKLAREFVKAYRQEGKILRKYNILLPPMWYQQENVSGKPYYFSTAGQSQYEKPSLPPGWYEAKNETGNPFYYSVGAETLQETPTIFARYMPNLLKPHMFPSEENTALFESLPRGWSFARDPQGQLFYFPVNTGVRQTEVPTQPVDYYEVNAAMPYWTAKDPQGKQFYFTQGKLYKNSTGKEWLNMNKADVVWERPPGKAPPSTKPQTIAVPQKLVQTEVVPHEPTRSTPISVVGLRGIQQLRNSRKVLADIPKKNRRTRRQTR